MEKIQASVGILTFNSAETLDRALESVKDFDDLIICDGGSSDETRAIAERYGARILEQDPAFKHPDGRLKDYSGVRNQCLEAAKHDYFLYIDSDESISPELHEDIRRITSEPLTPVSPLVYRVPQVPIMDGVLIRYSSFYPAYQHRFFNKKSGARFDKPVHERIYFDTAARIGTLKGAWHTYRSRDEWVHYFSRMRKYRDMEVAGASQQSFPRYLRWTVLESGKTALSTFIKAVWVYLLHGFAQTLPVRGELGRAFSPLAVAGRLTLIRLKRLL